MHKIKNTFNKTCQALPILLLLVIVFITYANTVDDLDFWWHLRQGQLIYETHNIPQKDLFSYTTEIPESIGKIGKNEVPAPALPCEKNKWFWLTNLKSSWLSQLIFYIAYLSGGFIGVGLLKSVIFVLAYFVLYLTMLRRGAGYWSSFLILCIIAYIGSDFNLSRPQIFSFLLFPCVLYALYDFRKGGKSIYLLPLIVLIWANLHGGFILGVLVIITFTFTELLKYLLNNKFGIQKLSSLNKGQLKTLGFLSFISIMASLINPNGYKTFLFPLVFKSSLFKIIEEYHRPMLYEYHAYWFLLFLAIISTLFLIKEKKLDMTELFLSAVLTIISLESIRFIIFFALGTGAFLSNSISYAGIRLREWEPFKKLYDRKFSAIDIKGYISLLLALTSIIILIKASTSGEILRFSIRESRYPSGAVDFIEKNKIKGEMFNSYNWGGYLIWHLYPDYKVFIDGRCLNETAYFHHNQIFWATQGNSKDIPLWKRLLDAYDINFIVTPAVSHTGSLIPLVDRLYLDRDWVLIYADGKSMILLRAKPGNRDLINKYHLSKNRIDDEVISECEQGIRDNPATWGYYETLGYMYMKKYRFNEALAMFKKYLDMNPDNKKVRYYHDLLKQYIDKKL